MTEKTTKNTKKIASGYVIRGYAQKISDIKTLWLDVKMEEMINTNLKDLPDKQFATILSNGIVVRPAWIQDMRLGNPREYDRVHAVLTATNKLIMQLNADIVNSLNKKREPLEMVLPEAIFKLPEALQIEN